MDWQQTVALVIVAVTAGIFLRNWLRPKQKHSSPCGCGASSAASGPKPSVVYHARKGERPQIIVKMK